MIVRLVLGSLLIYFGLRDALGYMGGLGAEAAAEAFATSFSVPMMVGLVAIYAELVSGVFILLGLFTRFAALLSGSLMAIAAVMGAANPEILTQTTSADALSAAGYPTALMTLSLVLIFMGGGMASVDSKVGKRLRKGRPARAAAES